MPSAGQMRLYGCAGQATALATSSTAARTAGVSGANTTRALPLF
jgi:hypothetical protein